MFQKVNFGYVRLHANLWKEINFGTFFFCLMVWVETGSAKIHAEVLVSSTRGSERQVLMSNTSDSVWRQNYQR